MRKFDQEFNLAGLRVMVSETGYPVYVGGVGDEFNKSPSLLRPVIIHIENIIHES